MAGKQNVKLQKFEFPFEWISAEWGQAPRFAFNEALIGQMNKLKQLNEHANADLNNRQDIARQSRQQFVLQDAQLTACVSNLGLQSLRKVTRAARQLHSTRSVDACHTTHAELVTSCSHNHVTLRRVASDLAAVTSVQDNLTNMRATLQAEVAAVPQKNDQLREELRQTEMACARLCSEATSLQAALSDIAERCEDVSHTQMCVRQLQECVIYRDKLRCKHDELSQKVIDFCDVTPDLRLARRDLEILKTALAELKGEIGFIVSSLAF